MRFVFLAIGTVLVAVVLWDAFEVMLLPLPIRRNLRFVMLLVRGTWRFWRLIAQHLVGVERRERFLGIYGPLSLVLLMVAWVIMLIVGFGLIHFALWPSTIVQAIYFSGTTFFTI